MFAIYQIPFPIPTLQRRMRCANCWTFSASRYMQLTCNMMGRAMGQPQLMMNIEQGVLESASVKEFRPEIKGVPPPPAGGGVLLSQVSRYGESRRLNLPALGMSVALVGGLITAFLAAGIIHVRKLDKPSIVVQMLSEPPPPAAPPPEAKPVETVKTPAPVVAPPPLVQMPAPPVQVATSPAPAPQVAVASSVTAPGPSAPQAAPPAIESMGDMSSTMIQAVPPGYPMESRRRQEEGVVVLMVLLGIDGRVSDISVSRSSGYGRLDNAALSAVRRWRWSPTRRGGRAVMVRGLVEIPFVLQGRERGGGRGHHRHRGGEDGLPLRDGPPMRDRDGDTIAALDGAAITGQAGLYRS